MGRRAQRDVAVMADQPQQEPDLLLSPVVPAPLAPDPSFRNVVAQPVAGAPNDPDMLGAEPGFLPEFPVHRLLGRFAPLDAPLRELPGMLPDPLAPEHLVATIDQNDADVRAIAVPVQHGYAASIL